MDPHIELRMQQHEPTMRQMVTGIHQSKLNIAQAAAKFEVNRKTVKRWLGKIESELTEPVVKKKYSSRRTVEHDAAQVIELSNQIHSCGSSSNGILLANSICCKILRN